MTQTKLDVPLGLPLKIALRTSLEAELRSCAPDAMLQKDKQCAIIVSRSAWVAPTARLHDGLGEGQGVRLPPIGGSRHHWSSGGRDRSPHR